MLEHSPAPVKHYLRHLGYVPTGANGVNGAGDEADVDVDINTYAGWASYYKPEGPRLEQVPGTAVDLQKVRDSDYTTYDPY